MDNAKVTKNETDRLKELGLELGETASERIVIEASPDRIWAAISKSGNLANYHPFVDANPAEIWPGEGARDHVVFYSGVSYQRDFTNWIEGVGYDLELGADATNKTALSTFRIETVSDTCSALTIDVTPYLKIGQSEASRKAYIERAFGDAILDYLKKAMKGVEAFVISGHPVKRNQFGAHPFYSPEQN